jgi:FkbM family methyltransferase
MKLFVVKQYIKIYRFIQKYFGFNIKGLGFMLDKIDSDFIFEVENKKFYFNHRIGRSYVVMINGHWAEPETHVFVNKILNVSSEKITFIDIGASIGEMVFDFAHHKKIGQVIAVEPNPEAVYALEKTKEINNFEFVHIYKTIASSKKETIEFPIDVKSPTGSSMYADHQKDFITLESVTVDDITQARLNMDRFCIILIDVEGYEISVLEGAKSFIRSNKPLIIFEYNQVSKQHFNLDDIKEVLSDEYDVFRLNSFGQLDKDFEKTWNCVAIHKKSKFYEWYKLLDQQGRLLD